MVPPPAANGRSGRSERIKPMRNAFATSAAVAALAFAGTGAAQAAKVIQESSMIYSAPADHLDLVLHYSSEAKIPLTINGLFVEDVTGAGVSQQQENSCGTPIKSGDTVVGYVMQPGGYCFVRAFPNGDGLAGKAELNDSTANANNINKFVRTSIEARDVNNNTLVHVEVH
jgi:hypothetical protein